MNRTHSRNHSDGSGSSQQGIPPTGTRVAPLGRETTPTPNGPQRIPREVWDRFEGKSREVSIEIMDDEFANLGSFCGLTMWNEIFKGIGHVLVTCRVTLRY